MSLLLGVLIGIALMRALRRLAARIRSGERRRNDDINYSRCTR